MTPGTQYKLNSSSICNAIFSITVPDALAAGQCSSFTVYGDYENRTAHAAGLKQVLMVGIVSALAWLSLWLLRNTNNY